MLRVYRKVPRLDIIAIKNGGLASVPVHNCKAIPMSTFKQLDVSPAKRSRVELHILKWIWWRGEGDPNSELYYLAAQLQHAANWCAGSVNWEKVTQ